MALLTELDLSPSPKMRIRCRAHRLRKLGLDVKQQYPFKVYDEDGTLIGDYSADLFVDNRLIIELKAAKALADEQVAQILGYLRSSLRLRRFNAETQRVPARQSPSASGLAMPCFR